MRFMMLVKADPTTEAGVLPTAEELAEVHKFNAELVKSGVLLAAEGLHPTARGARVRFAHRRPTVIEGPFGQTEELVAGFWLIQVRSREEAIEWATRVPFVDGEVELRQVFEAADLIVGDPSGELRDTVRVRN
jgi:hypothetical protein